MPDNDETTYAHLLTFLQSEREDVLESAAEAALTVATNRDRRIPHNLVKYSIIPPLTRLINRPRRIGYLSLATLLHLTSTTNDDDKTTTTNDNNNKNTTTSTARAASDEILSSRGLERAVEVGLSYSSFRHDDGDDDDTKRQHVNHAMSLMVNLTIDEKGAGRLLSSRGDAIGDKEAFEKLELLVGRFMDGTYRRGGGNDDDELAAAAAAAGGGAFSLLDGDESNDDDDDEREGEKGGVRDPYQHVSSILENVTQIEVGRRFVLSSNVTVGGGILPPLLKSIVKEMRSSSNPVRRRGCAGTVKNCCFEPERARLWVLPLANENNSYGEDDDIIFSLLLPLAGPEEISCDDERLMIGEVLLSRMGPEKIRERDDETRLLIVETILLLCAAGRRVREILRARGTYVVLKSADMVEEREDVSEKIEECVQFLKRDEEGTKEGSSDEMALELARKMQRKTTIKEMEDYDDVD